MKRRRGALAIFEEGKGYGFVRLTELGHASGSFLFPLDFFDPFQNCFLLLTKLDS